LALQPTDRTGENPLAVRKLHQDGLHGHPTQDRLLSRGYTACDDLDSAVGVGTAGRCDYTAAVEGGGAADSGLDLTIIRIINRFVYGDYFGGTCY